MNWDETGVDCCFQYASAMYAIFWGAECQLDILSFHSAAKARNGVKAGRRTSGTLDDTLWLGEDSSSFSLEFLN
jgi:hypothetical protein